MRIKNFILPLLTILFLIIIITSNAAAMPICYDYDEGTRMCGDGTGSYLTTRVYECQCPCPPTKYQGSWVQVEVCSSPYVCSVDQCVCSGSCSGKTCGQDNGCGVRCTNCPTDYTCDTSTWTCKYTGSSAPCQSSPNCVFLSCSAASCGSGYYCNTRECCGGRYMGVCQTCGTDYICSLCRSAGQACTYGAGYNGECCSLECVSPGRCCPTTWWWNGSTCVAPSEFPTALVGIIAVIMVVLLAVFIPKLTSKRKK